MTSYIIRRLFWGLVILFLVSVIVFFSVRLLPGDPVLMFVAAQQTGGTMTEEQLQALRVEYGLDKPVAVQFGNWIKGMVTGDLGKSIHYRQDVSTMLRERFPVTLYLGIWAIVISTVLGIFLGLVAAIRRGTWIDTVVTILSYVGLVIPVFLLGILLIYLLAIKLKWLPVVGFIYPWDGFWESMKTSVMPVICLAATPLAVMARQMRSSVLEVNNMDYVRTAWSKGLRERVVLTRHVLKNSLVPVITLLGISVGITLGGSVIVEYMFAIPGMGRLLVESVFNRDYVVIQGGTLLLAGVIVLVNLMVDISYGWFDPRIRYE